MLIIGAGGFAKEVLEICRQLQNAGDIVFFDDVNIKDNDVLYNQFPIFRTHREVIDFFKKNGNHFTIGIGNPILRYKVCKKFEDWGGDLLSVVSPFARVGHFDCKIGIGCNILSNSNISNSVLLGKGCIVYYNVVITHDCEVGDFVELSPGATLLGRSRIGDFTQIGANATVLPDIEIGRNVMIGAGAVVTKNIPDNCIAAGIPAKIIRSRGKMIISD